MRRFKLQDFGDGSIYRNVDKTYTVETPYGSTTGSSVTESLSKLSKLINSKVEKSNKAIKKTKHKE